MGRFSLLAVRRRLDDAASHARVVLIIGIVTLRGGRVICGTGVVTTSACEGLFRVSALDGAVKAGRTKLVCGIGSFERGSLGQIPIPVENPERALGDVPRYFPAHAERFGPSAGLGIGSVGGLDLDTSGLWASRYNVEAEMAGRGFAGLLIKASGLPSAISTDVDVSGRTAKHHAVEAVILSPASAIASGVEGAHLLAELAASDAGQPSREQQNRKYS